MTNSGLMYKLDDSEYRQTLIWLIPLFWPFSWLYVPSHVRTSYSCSCQTKVSRFDFWEHSSSSFAERCYASAAYAVARCPSVRLFVRLSRLCILSKRINLSSHFSPSASHTILTHKICLLTAIFLETVQDRDILQWTTNKNLYTPWLTVHKPCYF